MKKSFLMYLLIRLVIQYILPKVPTVNKCDVCSFVAKPDNRLEDILWFLASMLIISKTKYIVCTSGNGELWLSLFRGHAENVYQYLNPKDNIYGIQNFAYTGPKSDYFLS